MQFKLGFGPMSIIVNRALAEYASMKQRPLMIIASRNQVDADSGYVMQTQALADQMEPLRSDYLMLCRDHCGPYFLDSERELSIKDAVILIQLQMNCFNFAWNSTLISNLNLAQKKMSVSGLESRNTKTM